MWVVVVTSTCHPLDVYKRQFFDCESRSLEEAQRLCENWLVGQDRCYRN